MTWHPNSNKHKAQHGGYRVKPTKTAINALFKMYAGIHATNIVIPSKKQEGIQLKIFFDEKKS